MAIKGALLIAATPYSSFSSLGSYIREYWQLVTATSILEADEKDGGAVNAPAFWRVAYRPTRPGALLASIYCRAFGACLATPDYGCL
jgi:hypothetical protein